MSTVITLSQARQVIRECVSNFAGVPVDKLDPSKKLSEYVSIPAVCEQIEDCICDKLRVIDGAFDCNKLHVACDSTIITIAGSIIAR